MPNPAQVSDLEDRWQPLSGQQVNNATALLGDAWVMLKRRIPDLDAKVDEDPDYSSDVVRVVCQMVLRVMRNPDGKRSESIDDYSFSRDSGVSGGLLYITDDELSDLLGAQSSSFSIRATANPFISCPPDMPLLGEWRDYGNLSTA